MSGGYVLAMLVDLRDLFMLASGFMLVLTLTVTLIGALLRTFR